MQRRTVLAGAGTVLATAVAGCLDDEDSPESLSAAAVADDQQADPADGAPLRVSGSGSVAAEPDRATFSVGIEETGDDADAVSDRLAARVEDVREALRSDGIEEDAIETSRFRLREQRQGTGYEATHSLSVEVDDVDRVGELIDTAVEAGADGIGRVNFTLEESTRAELREQALERAINDAREEAEHVAGVKEMEIVGVAEVDVEDRGFSPFQTRYAVTEADDAADTDIQEGDVDVSASVSVTYVIE